MYSEVVTFVTSVERSPEVDQRSYDLSDPLYASIEESGMDQG